MGEFSRKGIERAPKVMNDIETWAKSLEETTRGSFEAMKDATAGQQLKHIIEKGKRAEESIATGRM